MHLILGHPGDPCCAGVLARLRERGQPALVLSDPFRFPARLSWWLDGDRVDSRFDPDRRGPIEISSVLVRELPLAPDPAPDEDVQTAGDRAYLLAETQASLLAWLTSLPCPVVNRPPAALWYRPRMPLLAWRTLLRRAGLSTPDILFTSDPGAAQAFGRQLVADGAGGALCTSLTSDAAWCITENDWSGVAAMQSYAPVCLTEPHGSAVSACIVAGEVVWDREPPPDAADLVPNLVRFASSLELTFLEVAIAPVRRGPVIVLVEPQVRLEHFHTGARDRVLDRLADHLAGDPVAAGRQRAAQ